jgi:hypothetical protein
VGDAGEPCGRYKLLQDRRPLTLARYGSARHCGNGGEFFGGCAGFLAAWRDGRAQRLLDASGVQYDRGAAIDPATFLPGWLQPR